MPSPVLLIHGYSTEGRTADGQVFTRASVAGLYGSLPGRLAAMGVSVSEVDVSRYISLDDGVGIEDVSEGMERAFRDPANSHLLGSGLCAIVHSTGALVVRNWVRRFAKDHPGTISKIIYLAGANHGSGWAHVGKAQLTRFARQLVLGQEAGVAVLNCLELASSWAIDLTLHFRRQGTRMREDYGILEFCLIGSQTPPEFAAVPVPYGKEDGSDGVVRVCCCNLNTQYGSIEPEDAVAQLAWAAAKQATSESPAPAQSADATDFYRLAQQSVPDGAHRDDLNGGIVDLRPIPFAVPYGTTHLDIADRTAIVSGSDSQLEIDPRLQEALSITEEGYDSLVAPWAAITQASRNRAATPAHTSVFADIKKDGLLGGLLDLAKKIVVNPVRQYDPHAQVVFRVRDHRGNPINDFSVYFNSLGGSGTPDDAINNLFCDTHKNNLTPNSIAFYLRVGAVGDGSGTSLLDKVQGINLEIDGVDPSTDRILYVPVRLTLSQDELRKWIVPDRTTVFDVVLYRLPADETFVIR